MTSIIIADKYGRPQAAADTAHRGASLTARDLAYWWPSYGSADADILPDLGTLIARTRDLERNNGIAHGAPQTIVDNVIGPRLKLAATPDWRALGKTKEWAQEWSRAVEMRFKSYSKSLWFDAEEQLNFTGMAALVLRGRLTNGGHLVLPTWLPRRPGAAYATAFMSIEIDRLSNPNDRPDTQRLRGGIEYNSHGAPVAYYIRNSHPGDFYAYNIGMGLHTWERIPARTRWGRQRVLHCFHKTRSGQSRGIPAMTAVLSDFKSLSRYRHAELQAAVANAMVTYFLETELGTEGIIEMFGSGENLIDSRAAYNSNVRNMVRGTVMDENIVVPLHPGERAHSPRQTRPNSEFSNFSEGVLRHIAAGLGLSYETLLRDFSRTNYSSARAAMLLDWKTYMGLREWLITYYCDPVFKLWLEECVNRGLIEAPDFYDNQDAYCAASWTGAARGQIDPVKETNASLSRLHNTLSTQQDEMGEQGKDYQEIQEQRAREIAEAFSLARELNLPESAAYVIAGLPAPFRPLAPDQDVPDDEPETEEEQAA